LPIGLSHLVMFDFDHSGDRDTRWAFCYSRGRGVGMLKMADFRFPSRSGGNLKEGGTCTLTEFPPLKTPN
jgi:hypothetical protein